MQVKHWIKLVAVTAVTLIIINYAVSKFAPASIKSLFVVS